MIEIFDSLLPRPVPPFLYHSLEFIFFVIHLFFVLLTVGTVFYALLALAHRLHSGGDAPPVDPEHGNTASSLPVYFASKSLMITFGIAVLLLVMAYYSVPFTGAANLNGAFWVGIIVFLSAALIVLEVFDRGIKKPGAGRGALRAGILGLALLLIVPGIFVAFVVTAENPGRWADIFRGGLVFTPLRAHWLARLLHVYGAAAVVAGMFYLVYARRTGKRVPVTPGILFGALMVQIVLGVLLYMSMPSAPGAFMNFFVFIGAAAAAGFAWLLFAGRPPGGGKWLLPSMLALILLPMLLARQVYQVDVLAPFNALLRQNARVHLAAVQRFAPAGGNRFLVEKFDDYNLPQFIFQRSCAFCHGGVGDGRGREAGNLQVPPADLTQLRARPGSVLAVLGKGVPGSAMPYFSVYTGNALKGLAGYLYAKVGMREEPEPVPVATAPDEKREAALVFARQCAGCHGADGKVGARGRKLLPSPPDMTQWALSPQQSFRIISEGNPGTSMNGFGQLPERVRWALVEFVNDFYSGRRRGPGKDQR